MKFLKAFLLVLMVSASAIAAPRPEVSRYVKAYSGDEAIKVFITRIGPAEKGEVLIQLSNVDHPLDGVIQKARVENNERGRRYIVQRNGDDYILLNIEGNGGTLYLPYLPNNPRSWHVAYDASLSGQARAEHILTAWLAQK